MFEDETMLPRLSKNGRGLRSCLGMKGSLIELCTLPNPLMPHDLQKMIKHRNMSICIQNRYVMRNEDVLNICEEDGARHVKLERYKPNYAESIHFLRCSSTYEKTYILKNISSFYNLKINNYMENGCFLIRNYHK